MYTLQFSSPDPLDHVCRALDTVRKMDLALASLQVDGIGDAFRVSIALDANDPSSAGRLRERVSSCVGVYEVTCKPEGRAGRCD